MALSVPEISKVEFLILNSIRRKMPVCLWRGTGLSWEDLMQAVKSMEDDGLITKPASTISLTSLGNQAITQYLRYCPRSGASAFVVNLRERSIEKKGAPRVYLPLRQPRFDDETGYWVVSQSPKAGLTSRQAGTEPASEPIHSEPI